MAWRAVPPAGMSPRHPSGPVPYPMGSYGMALRAHVTRGPRTLGAMWAWRGSPGGLRSSRVAYVLAGLGFLVLGGRELTWDSARSTQRAARPGSARQAAGSVMYPAIGRSAGPKGPEPPMAASSLRPASSSRTPTSAPNSPANMFPFTNAPRLPNIGLTSTAGPPGMSDLKNCLSSSLGLGISMCAFPRVLVDPRPPGRDSCGFKDQPQVVEVLAVGVPDGGGHEGSHQHGEACRLAAVAQCHPGRAAVHGLPGIGGLHGER